MSWKEFFKPTKGKIIIFIILIVLSILFGFFETSNCFIDENGEEICRMCGQEGIFNPVLRPFSFLIGNIYKGILESHNFAVCGGPEIYWSIFIFDLFYLYIVSCLLNRLIFKDRRRRKK